MTTAGQKPSPLGEGACAAPDEVGTAARQRDCRALHLRRCSFRFHEFKTIYPNLELFGLFIQGSQNYGLDIYTDEYKSDIDTKAIVIPSLEDVVLNKKPISTTHILYNNEHLDIKDIRLYFNNFKKQNINFIEILFACAKYINPEYKDLYDSSKCPFSTTARIG